MLLLMRLLLLLAPEVAADRPVAGAAERAVDPAWAAATKQRARIHAAYAVGLTVAERTHTHDHRIRPGLAERRGDGRV